MENAREIYLRVELGNYQETQPLTPLNGAKIQWQLWKNKVQTKLKGKCRVMSYITKFAEGFMHLFQTGAETFISWMTGIVPVVLMLMVAMNTLIAF